MRQRRRFQRPLGKRRYRKLFIISVEGAVTEHQYFAVFNKGQSIVQVNCLKSRHHSAPQQVLKRMMNFLRKQSLMNTDEAWVVTDKDQWTDEQLAQLHAWSQGNSNYGFALSNPNFEYWLLLHFEDGTGITGSRNCTERLKRHLPDYDKHIDARNIMEDRVNDAIRRGKNRDNPPCTDWPKIVGSTTVYRLVENLIKAI